jgi:hypothetical protein
MGPYTFSERVFKRSTQMVSIIMKKKKLRTYLCDKCGKELPITVPPYLREGLRKQGRLCECNGGFCFKKP